MSCERCNPIIMAREGCCANNCNAAGKGMKDLKVVGKNSGELHYVISVCSKLQKNPETAKWYCSIYSHRPEICQMFNCDRELQDRSGEDY